MNNALVYTSGKLVPFLLNDLLHILCTFNPSCSRYNKHISIYLYIVQAWVLMSLLACFKLCIFFGNWCTCVVLTQYFLTLAGYGKIVSLYHL